MENVAAVFLPIRAPMSWLDLRVISECTDLVARVLAVAGFLKAAREGNVAEGRWASERQLAWARTSTSERSESGPSRGPCRVSVESRGAVSRMEACGKNDLQINDPETWQFLRSVTLQQVIRKLCIYAFHSFLEFLTFDFSRDL